MMTVTDTGGGVSDEIRHRVFEPLFTPKAPGKGTGFGRAVVQRFVEECGCGIALDRAIDRGATVGTKVPPVDIPVPLDIPSVGDRPLVRGHGERVLVVEDEPSAREGLADLVTSLGYTVVTTASGEEATALPAEPEVARLLTDLMLPGITGPQLAGRLTARWPLLRMILMSGYTEDEATKRRITADWSASCNSPSRW